jgi:hypothetical protein
MITFSLFILSGTAIVTLTLAKRVEERRKKPFFLLRAITKGDKRMRELHHKAVYLYHVSKERTGFVVKKQLPMRVKSSFNKLVARLAEEAEKRIGNIRDIRSLKKPNDISEFFKTMSEVEKGVGEINETLPEEVEVSEEYKEVAVDLPEPAPGTEIAKTFDNEESAPQVKVLRPRKPRKPRVKRAKATLEAPTPVSLPTSAPTPMPRVRKPRVKKLKVEETIEA